MNSTVGNGSNAGKNVLVTFVSENLVSVTRFRWPLAGRVSRIHLLNWSQTRKRELNQGSPDYCWHKGVCEPAVYNSTMLYLLLSSSHLYGPTINFKDRDIISLLYGGDKEN